MIIREYTKWQIKLKSQTMIRMLVRIKKICGFHAYLIWKTQQKANNHLKKSNLTSYHYFLHKTIQRHQYKISYMQNGWNVKNVQQHGKKKRQKIFCCMDKWRNDVSFEKSFWGSSFQKWYIIFLLPKVAFLKKK